MFPKDTTTVCTAFKPPTFRLWGDCSTTELLLNRKLKIPAMKHCTVCMMKFTPGLRNKTINNKTNLYTKKPDAFGGYYIQENWRSREVTYTVYVTASATGKPDLVKLSKCYFPDTLAPSASSNSGHHNSVACIPWHQHHHNGPRTAPGDWLPQRERIIGWAPDVPICRSASAGLCEQVLLTINYEVWM